MVAFGASMWGIGVRVGMAMFHKRETCVARCAHTLSEKSTQDARVACGRATLSLGVSAIWTLAYPSLSLCAAQLLFPYDLLFSSPYNFEF